MSGESRNWFVEHGVRILILAAIAAVAVIYANSRTKTVERLDAIEETVTYEPPRSYVPPAVDDYAATGVALRSLQVKRSVYVPVYSHIYYDGGRPYLLEATLSVRNTDVEKPLYVSSVRYYDTHGKLAKTFAPFKDMLDEFVRKNMEAFEEARRIIGELDELLEAGFGGAEASS